MMESEKKKNGGPVEKGAKDGGERRRGRMRGRLKEQRKLGEMGKRREARVAGGKHVKHCY